MKVPKNKERRRGKEECRGKRRGVRKRNNEVGRRDVGKKERSCNASEDKMVNE